MLRTCTFHLPNSRSANCWTDSRGLFPFSLSTMLHFEKTLMRRISARDSQEKASAEIGGEFLCTNSQLSFAGVDFWGLLSLKNRGKISERGRGVTERGGNGSENFSALLSTFLTIWNKKSYSKNLWKPLKISENLSELFGPLPLCPLPLYLFTKIHPRNLQQNSNRNLGVSQPESTLQESGLEGLGNLDEPLPSEPQHQGRCLSMGVLAFGCVKEATLSPRREACTMPAYVIGRKKAPSKMEGVFHTNGREGCVCVCVIHRGACRSP